MAERVLRISVKTSGAKAKTRELSKELGRLKSQGVLAAGGVNKLSSSLIGMQGVIAGVGFGALVTDITKAGGKLESLSFRLASVSKNVGDELNYVRETSKRLSSDYITLNDSYSRLLTLQDAGLITQTEARDLTEGLAGAQLSMGASTEQLKQALLGLSQSLGQGIVRGEEFLQIFDPMPALQSRIEKANNLSAGSLRKMMLAGELTADRFIKLATPALKEFEAQSESMGQTFDATTTKLSNQWFLLRANLGQELNTSLTPLLQELTDVLEYMADNTDEVVGSLETVGKVAVAAVGVKAVSAFVSLGNATELSVRKSLAHTAAIVADEKATLRKATADKTAAQIAVQRGAAIDKEVISIKAKIAAKTEEEILDTKSAAATRSAIAKSQAKVAAKVAERKAILAATDAKIAELSQLRLGANTEKQQAAIGEKISTQKKRQINQRIALTKSLDAQQAVTFSNQAKREKLSQLAAKKTLSQQSAAVSSYTAQNLTTAAAKERLIVAENVHAAALARTTLAMKAATVSTRAYGVASRLASGALGLVGGPAGVATLAAFGMYEYVSSIDQYKGSIDEVISDTERHTKALRANTTASQEAGEAELKKRLALLAELKAKNQGLVAQGLGGFVDFFNYDEEIKSLESTISQIRSAYQTASKNIVDTKAKEDIEGVERELLKLKNTASNLAISIIPEDEIKKLNDTKQKLQDFFNKGAFSGNESQFNKAVASINDQIQAIKTDAAQEQLEALKDKAEAAQGILDRLYPDQAKANQYREEIQAIKTQLSIAPTPALKQALIDLEAEFKKVESSAVSLELIGRSFQSTKEDAEPLKSLLSELFPQDTAAQAYTDQQILLNQAMQDSPNQVGVLQEALKKLEDQYNSSGLNGKFKELQDELNRNNDLSAISNTGSSQLDSVNAGEFGSLESEQAKYTQQLELARQFSINKAQTETEGLSLIEEITRQHEQRVTDIKAQAEQQRALIRQAEFRSTLSAANTVQNGLFALLQAGNSSQANESKKSFEKNKKYSIAQAKVAGGIAIANALATSPWYLAAAQAAIALRKTQQNIQSIKSTTYSGGGSVSSGSGGGGGGTGGGAAQVNQLASSENQESNQIVQNNYYGTNYLDMDKVDNENAKSMERIFNDDKGQIENNQFVANVVAS